MEQKTVGQVELQAAVKPRMSAAEVARRVGVTDQAVSAWVRGVARPDPKQMAKLEEILGIPMRAWTEAATAGDESPDESGSNPVIDAGKTG